MDLYDYLHQQYWKLNKLSDENLYHKHRLTIVNFGHDGVAVGTVSSTYQVVNPVTKHFQQLNFAIMELNDEHKWTREKIADWLDTLDKQPVFYPKIDKPISPRTLSVYIRYTSAGSQNVQITYGCQCRIKGSRIYCGKCERTGGLLEESGHLCYACPNEGGPASGDLWL